MVLLIVAVIVVNSLGLTEGGGVDINCDLNILKTNSQCREEEAAAAATPVGIDGVPDTPTPTPAPPGDNSATPTPIPATPNNNSTGNSTRRLLMIESGSPFWAGGAQPTEVHTTLWVDVASVGDQTKDDSTCPPNCPVVGSSLRKQRMHASTQIVKGGGRKEGETETDSHDEIVKLGLQQQGSERRRHSLSGQAVR
mmetsp:Transcript_14847/g.23103  ORF Transcript_14847/g.23103 Transcript_14847/m.23103 type:complete len:196 (-) Transcript_14847:1218-1805(-)